MEKKKKRKRREKGVGSLFQRDSRMRGRPRGRSVDCNPSVSAVAIRQPSSPYGLPRVTQRRNDANSDSDCGALTCSTQTEGIATVQGAKSRSAVPCTRCHKLPQRQVSACLTRLARRGLRST